MKYKIGDVARILGISTDLLRYYEKKGVVHPIKDKTNDYRYYEPWDINFLLDCLWFKNFGFGIEEISGMVSDSTYDDLYVAIGEKEQEIMDNIRRQKQLLRRIRTYRTELTHAQEYLGKIDIRESPEVARYLNRHNLVYDDSIQLSRLSQEWLQYMPFVHRCFEIRQDDLPGMDGGDNYSWGLSLDMSYVKEFDVALDPPVEHLPVRKSIHSVFKSSGKNAFSPQHLDYIMEYAEKNSLRICGNANGNLLCSVVDDGKLTGFFEVWIPIE